MVGQLSRSYGSGDLTGVSWHYTETIRECSPGETTYDDCDRLATALLDGLGAGFEGVVRDQVGRRLSPGWLDCVGAAVAERGSRAVFSASLSHRALGLSGALDLGARDGRNQFAWSEDIPTAMAWPHKGLVLADPAARTTLPLPRWRNMSSVAITPDGGTAYSSMYWGGVDAVSGIVGASLGSGEMWHVTSLPNTPGAGRLRLSPDGRWLLSESAQRCALIEVASGKSLVLPVDANADWWPRRPSTIASLEFDGGSGSSRLRLFDLESADFLPDVGVLSDPSSQNLTPDRRYLSGLTISPDGRMALVGSWGGVSQEHAEKHGCRARVALVDLDSLSVEPVSAPFVDEQHTLEREHSQFGWVGPREPMDVRIHASLLQQAVPSQGQPPDADPTVAAMDAHDVVVVCMRQLISGQPFRTVPIEAIRPELVRAVQAAKDDQPERWDELSQWLDQVTALATDEAVRGYYDEPCADSVLKLRRAYQLVQAGHGARIDLPAESQVFRSPHGYLTTDRICRVIIDGVGLGYSVRGRFRPADLLARVLGAVSGDVSAEPSAAQNPEYLSVGLGLCEHGVVTITDGELSQVLVLTFGDFPDWDEGRTPVRLMDSLRDLAQRDGSEFEILTRGLPACGDWMQSSSLVPAQRLLDDLASSRRGEVPAGWYPDPDGVTDLRYWGAGGWDQCGVSLVDDQGADSSSRSVTTVASDMSTRGNAGENPHPAVTLTPERGRSVTTWNQLVQYVKENYEISDERPDRLRLVFDVGQGRSQLVFLFLQTLRDGQEEWLDIESPIGPISRVNLVQALDRVGNMVSGGLSQLGDLVSLKHSVPIAGLDVNGFERPLRLVIQSADRLEKELVGGDQY